MNRTKRTFFPRRSFEQDLHDFIRLAKHARWQFSGVDFEQLARDAIEQSGDRTRFNELEARLNALREHFARAQEQRYRRFAMALKAARAAFRDDERISASLDRFKHSHERAAPAAPKQARMKVVPHARGSTAVVNGGRRN